ncbi:MAG: hypothetical protein WC467_01600 [Patescibacteria group bacterium]
MRIFGLITLLFFFACLNHSQAQSNHIEPSLSGGIGYITDNSGNGTYQYATGGASVKSGQSLYGGFIAFTNVNVLFGGYNFTAKEYTVGPSLIGWGKLNRNYSYAYWLMPGFKLFRDYGHDASMQQEAWQRDAGTYSIAGANFTDSLNRWFRSYKLQIQFQKNLWSKRAGQWNGDGNIGDSINYKAVNKAYFKIQFEAAAKRFNLGNKGRLEPKLVIGYLYDGGAKKSYYEFGSGIAISFMKNDRYYEPFTLQYRARYGVEFGSRLDVFEINSDIIAIWRLLKK